MTDCKKCALASSLADAHFLQPDRAACGRAPPLYIDSIYAVQPTFGIVQRQDKATSKLT
jgi:hypothetical protein